MSSKNKLLKLPPYEVPDPDGVSGFGTDFPSTSWRGKLLKGKKTPVIGAEFIASTKWALSHNERFLSYGDNGKAPFYPKAVMLSVGSTAVGDFITNHQPTLDEKRIHLNLEGTGTNLLHFNIGIANSNPSITITVINYDYFTQTYSADTTTTDPTPLALENRYIGGRLIMIGGYDFAGAGAEVIDGLPVPGERGTGYITSHYDEIFLVNHRIVTQSGRITNSALHWARTIACYNEIKVHIYGYKSNSIYDSLPSNGKTIVNDLVTNTVPIISGMANVTYTDLGNINSLDDYLTDAIIWDLVKTFYDLP